MCTCDEFHEYKEEDYLQIAEIQHYQFCPRQWGLIYLEHQWAENVLTVEGTILHQKAHDPQIKEKRGKRIVVRSMRVSSPRLGVTGMCDVVEFIRDETGISIPKYQGKYRVLPVEYKRGRPKEGNEDIFQLTLEAMCLEDMLITSIPEGCLYYGEIHHRTAVPLTRESRTQVKKVLQEIREFRNRKYTPRVKRRRGCKNCSMKNLCLPELPRTESAREYLARRLSE